MSQKLIALQAYWSAIVKMIFGGVTLLVSANKKLKYLLFEVQFFMPFRVKSMLRPTRNDVGVKSTPKRVGPCAISSGVDHRDAQPAAVFKSL